MTFERVTEEDGPVIPAGRDFNLRALLLLRNLSVMAPRRDDGVVGGVTIPRAGW